MYAPIGCYSATRKEMTVASPNCLRVVGFSLLAAPFGGALSQESAYSLLGVVTAEGGGEGLLLGLDALVEVAGGGDTLDLLHRYRGLAGELAAPHQGRLEELVVGDYAVG